mmetsp:Transcript_10383/g.17393  ORF Transcript_10383/g.17393 Transcript_10383/m.17393 type:complete len:98 (-) Transcript_10383:218-511(-)
MGKDAIMWVNVSSRSLHWGKKSHDDINSKFITLYQKKKGNIGMAVGENKGAYKSLAFDKSNTITISLWSGKQLEMKMGSSQKVTDWATVLQQLYNSS